VISDVSPNISGIWELDHARQIDLARSSLCLAISILKSGGNFFVKVFQGNMTNKFVSETKNYFSFVKLVKPRASRSKSAELYLLGMNFTKK
ncbi:RlmE family RNA methyltransferase, partial [Candidatus Bathyarchaeota archaeon]|nr:RlmE family RNA methyltransferase [Candidatus Bathyarchaeota archaeon]